MVRNTSGLHFDGSGSDFREDVTEIRTPSNVSSERQDDKLLRFRTVSATSNQGRPKVGSGALLAGTTLQTKDDRVVRPQSFLGYRTHRSGAFLPPIERRTQDASSAYKAGVYFGLKLIEICLAEYCAPSNVYSGEVEMGPPRTLDRPVAVSMQSTRVLTRLNYHFESVSESSSLSRCSRRLAPRTSCSGWS